MKLDARAMLSAVTVTLALMCVSSASANDASFGGDAAELVPISETRIRMVSEDIVISEVGARNGWSGDHWEIRATYVFENTSKEVVTTTVGFPERKCEFSEHCRGNYTFHNMKTTVGGKPVKMRVGEAKDKLPDGLKLGRVHLFELEIKPGERATIKHAYDMDISSNNDGTVWLTYVTRTGTFWKGSIGHARFTIKPMERPWSFVYPKSYKLQKYTTTMKRGRPATEIVFEMKDWKPEHDLHFFSKGSLFNSQKCPWMTPLVWSLADMNLAKPKIDWAGVDEELESYKMTASRARVCRNMVYAHHGYKFKDKALDELFYPTSFPTSATSKHAFMWAEDVGSDTPDDLGPGRDWREDYMFVGDVQNKSYDPAMLSKEELVWVKLMKHIEAPKKKRSARKP